MSEVRPAELAGTWYPESTDACRARFDAWRNEDDADDDETPSIGVVVPHGGWDISGALAFRALRRLARTPADVVVVLGAHLEPSDPPRIFIEGGFETPFGPRPVAEALSKQVALSWDAEPETPEEYYDDNAAEVLMPMIGSLWPQAELVVGAVPPRDDASRLGAELADLLLAAGRPAVCIASVDLTHYGADYGFRPAGPVASARDWVLERNDPPLLDAIRRVDGARVVWTARQHRNTCSAGSLAAALTLSRKLGARAGRIDVHTTSWDLGGRPSDARSFVSYASARLHTRPGSGQAGSGVRGG